MRQQWKLIVSLILLVASVAYMWSSLRGSSLPIDPNSRMFVCSETGKSFSHRLVTGEIEPVPSPHSGKNTGWMAEECYWTKDSQGNWKAKKKPTYVILRSRMGQDGPTTCPDCGRAVVGHNPRPPKAMMDAAE